jgi:hypothetical protein
MCCDASENIRAILLSASENSENQRKHGKERGSKISSAINLGGIMPELLLAAKKFGNRLRHHISA